MEPVNDLLLTPAQAGELLGLTKKSVERYCDAGLIPHEVSKTRPRFYWNAPKRKRRVSLRWALDFLSRLPEGPVSRANLRAAGPHREIDDYFNREMKKCIRDMAAT